MLFRSEDGRVEFYLPKGSWTYFFNGEVYEGGRWYQESYDYFHLPLFVRENAILARGNEMEKPDYDYCKQVTFHVYELQDKQCIEAEVMDGTQKDPLCLKISRNNNEILINLNRIEDHPTIVLHDHRMEIPEYSFKPTQTESVITRKEAH